MFKSILKPAFFCYSHVEVANLANLGVSNQVINISNDSDFEVFEIRSVINAPAVLTSGVFVQLSLASGELFSNVAIDYKSVAQVDGTANGMLAGYPVRLPSGVRIPANSTINVVITNNSGQAVDFQLQLWGYKVEKTVE